MQLRFSNSEFFGDGATIIASKILISEADVRFRMAYVECLQQRGFGAIGCSDGLACLCALRRFTPDLVILSSGLLWGGVEGVLQRVHEDRTLPPTLAMILADNFDSALIDKPYSAMVCGYFLKPLPPELLPDCVRRSLWSRQYLGSQRSTYRRFASWRDALDEEAASRHLQEEENGMTA